MAGTVGVIQARMGSTRLPGKILAPVAKRPLLQLLWERVREARVSSWWLATSTDPTDDVTAWWGRELGLNVFRGSLEDVLSRFTGVARTSEAEWLVRLTADDPFIDAELVNRLIDGRDEQGKASDLVSLAHAAGLPLGYGVQLLRSQALIRSEAQIPANAPHHRAHVATWLAAQSNRCVDLERPACWPDRSGWRWTVDTERDLAMASQAFALFGERACEIGYVEMAQLLDAAPAVTRVNADVPQKAIAEG